MFFILFSRCLSLFVPYTTHSISTYLIKNKKTQEVSVCMKFASVVHCCVHELMTKLSKKTLDMVQCSKLKLSQLKKAALVQAERFIVVSVNCSEV